MVSCDGQGCFSRNHECRFFCFCVTWKQSRLRLVFLDLISPTQLVVVVGIGRSLRLHRLQRQRGVHGAPHALRAPSLLGTAARPRALPPADDRRRGPASGKEAGSPSASWRAATAGPRQVPWRPPRPTRRRSHVRGSAPDAAGYFARPGPARWDRTAGEAAEVDRAQRSVVPFALADKDRGNSRYQLAPLYCTVSSRLCCAA